MPKLVFVLPMLDSVLVYAAWRPSAAATRDRLVGSGVAAVPGLATRDRPVGSDVAAVRGGEAR
jgi:hypothetical protein